MKNTSGSEMTRFVSLDLAFELIPSEGLYFCLEKLGELTDDIEITPLQSLQ
jgi:hypothetical protein